MATTMDKTVVTSFLLIKNIEEINSNSDTTDSDSEDEVEESYELELIYLIFMIGEIRGETVLKKSKIMLNELFLIILERYSKNTHFR